MLAKRRDRPSWPQADIEKLRRLARDKVPIWIIGVTLGRSTDEIVAKAEEEGVGLLRSASS